MTRLSTALALIMSVSIATPPLVLFPTSQVQAQEKQAKATLIQLTEVAEGRVARLVTSVRRSEAPELSPDSATGKPVWAALKDLNAAAAALANGAALKDDSFHKALGEMVSRTAAAASALELSGAEDATVNEAKDKLIETVGAVQERFSKSAARSEKGGALSASEQQKLDKIRKNQGELQKRLNAMEAKVQGNARALNGLREVRRRSEVITGSGSSVADFLAALVALRIIDGLLWGCHWWWGPWGGWYPDFSLVIVDIHEEIITDIEYDWDLYGMLEADVGSLDLDADFDPEELTDAEDALAATEIDLSDGLDESALEGVAEVTPEDLENPDLGLAEDLEAEGSDMEAAVDDGMEDTSESLETELPTEPEPAIEPEPTIEPEPMIEAEPSIEPEPMPEVDVMPEASVEDFGADDLGVEDMGADDFGGDMDFGGMDDLGGGFDFE